MKRGGSVSGSFRTWKGFVIIEAREEAKKPNQIGFREYIFPIYENPCGPWNEITADETFRESRP